MPIENPFPLNISNKVNSPALLAWFAQFGEEGYLSAVEINKIKIALDYLKESIVSGGSNLFLGSYTSLANLEAAHPSAEPGSRATIFVADGDDDLALWDNGDSNWFIIQGAGAIVQDNHAKVIEFDLLTTFGTPDFAALTAGAISDKLNILSADILPIEIPFVKISKDVTGLYQIYVLEGIGAGNTSAVVASNVKLLVDASNDFTTAFLKKAIATTGNVIQFDTDRVYNSISSPTTGVMSNNLSGAQIKIVQKIYYNHSTTNPFPVGWVRLGSKTYTPSALNIIYAEWVGGSRVEYWISQEA